MNYAQSICFESSIKHGVFDIVQQNEPITKAEIIKKACYGKRGGEALINVITAQGLLKCIDGKYHLTGILIFS